MEILAGSLKKTVDHQSVSTSTLNPKSSHGRLLNYVYNDDSLIDNSLRKIMTK